MAGDSHINSLGGGGVHRRRTPRARLHRGGEWLEYCGFVRGAVGRLQRLHGADLHERRRNLGTRCRRRRVLCFSRDGSLPRLMASRTNHTLVSAAEFMLVNVISTRPRV